MENATAFTLISPEIASLDIKVSLLSLLKYNQRLYHNSMDVIGTPFINKNNSSSRTHPHAAKKTEMSNKKNK